MKESLIETLLNRNIIQPGTLIYGKVEAASLGQDMYMFPMELLFEDYRNKEFHCRDKFGSPFIIKFDDLLEIDGMEPDRLASSFNIKSDGTDKPVGKKRGRKAKVRI